VKNNSICKHNRAILSTRCTSIWCDFSNEFT